MPRGGVASLFQAARWPHVNAEQLARLRDGSDMRLAEPHFMSYSIDALTSPGAVA